MSEVALTPAPTAVRRIFLAKAVRTYCYGFLGVLFPLHLSALGAGPETIGIALTLTLAASAAMTLAIRRPTERLGSRTVLTGLASLTVVSGLLFATARSPAGAVVAAMLGNLAVGVGESGPFLSVEQVLVARAVSASRLTLRMSLYNLTGYVAAGLGALTVALVGRTVAAAGAGAIAGGPPALLFWIFAASGLLQMALYAGLEPGAPDPGRRAVSGGAARHSTAFIYRLAALFALDALAGGFVLQSLVAYWFVVRFGLDLEALGAIFFGTQVLTALSLLVAARVAPWLGLVNTMVFSHLVSNVLLIAMALARTPEAAVALLLLRALLSQMDVPTRQTFLMTVVHDHERERAATVTNAARTVAQAVSPAITGFVMQAVGLSAPFVLGGGLKIVYDLLLYATCRRAARERGAAR